MTLPDTHPYIGLLQEVNRVFASDWAELVELRRITGKIYYGRIAMDNAAVQAALNELDNFYRDKRGD